MLGCSVHIYFTVLELKVKRDWKVKRIFYKSQNWKLRFCLVCKFSLDFINILSFISKNILSKVILQYHVSILTCPSRVTQNPFQNNKNCESSVTFMYQSEILKICIRSYLPFLQRLLWNLSLLHVRTRNGVISFYVLALQRLLHSVACVSFLSMPFYYLNFCGVYYLLRYWRKFCQYL